MAAHGLNARQVDDLSTMTAQGRVMGRPDGHYPVEPSAPESGDAFLKQYLEAQGQVFGCVGHHAREAMTKIMALLGGVDSQS